jgi:predicted acetyltransferase
MNYRLNSNNVKAIIDISKCDDFPIEINENIASIYCNNKDSIETGTYTYGVFMEEKLVSVMTATYLLVFPHPDNPNGKITHISGAYTRPEYRHRGLASVLLKEIEKDSMLFGSDYICCYSSADKLYEKYGFKYSTESRMWKIINKRLQ